MSASMIRVLGNICFVSGFASVLASIGIWFLMKEPDPAHGERYGIFVGLWAPHLLRAVRPTRPVRPAEDAHGMSRARRHLSAAMPSNSPG